PWNVRREQSSALLVLCDKADADGAPVWPSSLAVEFPEDLEICGRAGHDPFVAFLNRELVDVHVGITIHTRTNRACAATVRSATDLDTSSNVVKFLRRRWEVSAISHVAA